MTAIIERWTEVAAARIPIDGLAALAPVRCRAGVAVHVGEQSAWVTLPAGDEDVLRWLRPVRGAEFYARRGGGWFRLGRRLPTTDAPRGRGGQTLDRAVVPAPAAITASP